MTAAKYEPHFYGPVQGVVVGENNTVTIIFQDGKQATVPFLAPPRPEHDLIGRDDLLRNLKSQLFGGQTLALCALNGLPGVGKTALCVFLANDREVMAHFQDGVLWAGLGREPDVLGLLGKWAIALGIAPNEIAKLTTVESRVDRIHASIGLRRMLLVCDDAWQVDAALAFRVGGPNCSHIITTRFPEIALRFAGNAIQLVHELNGVYGLRLLEHLAPQVVLAEPDEAQELVVAVGGLPLALLLIGNYLRIRTFGGQPRQIRDAIDRIKQAQERLQLAEPQPPGERHPSLPKGAWVSLDAVIALSDESMDEAGRLALRQVSVLPPKPNTFSEDAGLAFLSGDAARCLDQLCDYGLLERSGSNRYMLHQTISDYGRLKLTDQTVYERIVNYFIPFLNKHKRDFDSLDPETSNISAALDIAFTRGMREPLVQGANVFYEFLSARGLYSSAETCLNRALDAATLGNDSLGVAVTTNNLGRVALSLGDYKRAEELYDTSLTLTRATGDNEKLASVLANLGSLALNRAQYGKAETYYAEGLSAARRVEDPDRISALLMGMGAVADSRAEYAKADELYRESLEIAREIGQYERMSVLLSNLGGIASERASYEQADAYLSEGLELARKIGHKENTSLLLSNLGQLAHIQHDYDRAEAFYKEGIAIAREIGHRKRLAVLLANFGALLGERGEFQRSEKNLTEALQLFRELGQRWFVSSTSVQLGELFLKEQKWEAASESFNEALAIAEELGSKDFAADALYGLGQVASALGNGAEAVRLGSQSLDLFESIGHKNAAEVKEWLATLK